MSGRSLDQTCWVSRNCHTGRLLYFSCFSRFCVNLLPFVLDTCYQHRLDWIPAPERFTSRNWIMISQSRRFHTTTRELKRAVSAALGTFHQDFFFRNRLEQFVVLRVVFADSLWTHKNTRLHVCMASVYSRFKRFPMTTEGRAARFLFVYRRRRVCVFIVNGRNVQHLYKNTTRCFYSYFIVWNISENRKPSVIQLQIHV